MTINKLPDVRDLEFLTRRMSTQFQLPSAYDDALSYQGLIYKLIQYLKDTMQNVEDWNVWLEDFVSTFDEKLGVTVKETIQSWIDDGTIQVIISEAVQWELDDYKTTNEQDKLSINQQLAQIANKFTNEINIIDFPRLSSETDDTQRLQRAIDSFEGNVAGTIVIPYDIYVSSQITCNKTGLRIVGLNNKISRIISTAPEKTFHIEPLYNGNPYTNVAYCKFYMDNISIIADGVAQETGIGLYLKWVYASSFLNLMTLGFKKHIVLKGSHLNTFYNLFQGNYDTDIRGTEIHNRGVGLSADGELDEAGESTSNNNHIIGGWINNTSFDFRNMSGTIVENIDIEPASDSFYTGDNTIVKSCRLERFDYYALMGVYDRFPWFVVGNSCKFYDNEYHATGPNNNVNINPIFQIEGNNNEITIPKGFSFNFGTMSFGENAKDNIITDFSEYTDFIKVGYKYNQTSFKLNNLNNKFIKIDKSNGNETTSFLECLVGKGMFTNRSSTNTELWGNENYIYQGCENTAPDIDLPFGRTENTKFAKITLTTDVGLRRFLLNTGLAQTVTTSGVYTLSALVYIPSTSTQPLKIGATLQAHTVIHARDKWIAVQSSCWLETGDLIQPTFVMEGGIGDVFYVGEISVCDGNNSVYIENSSVDAVKKIF